MSPPTVNVAADGKRSSSKSGRSPLKKKNVIVEHFSRCDKVEVDLSSYEKETEAALLKLPSQLQNEEFTETINLPNPEQLDHCYYDNENGLHTPEEVASDGDTFFTPQSAVRSISKRNQWDPSQEVQDEERTPLGSTSCAKSAFDRDELEVSFKEMDEVAERLNKSLVSHIGPQPNTISIHDRVNSVQEELQQNELNSEWKSPQKKRPGFESEYIAERQSLPYNFATGLKPIANRSLREEQNGLSHIREDQVMSDHEMENNESVQGKEVDDSDATPTKEKNDISRGKTLGYQLQQSVKSTEISDQMEIQLEEANTRGEVVQLTTMENLPDSSAQQENDEKHNKSMNFDDVLDNISLYDCSLVDHINLRDSGRRFRNVSQPLERSTTKNDMHRTEPVAVSSASSERLYRQKSVNKYVTNLAKWLEVERMRINSRGLLTERDSFDSTELISEAKRRYEARSSLVQSLINGSMNLENFKFLMEEMTTLLNDQVKAAVEEVSANCELIRHNRESTRKHPTSARTVGTSMTPRAPVALETADLDKSVELRRWSLHEKPAVMRTQSVQNEAEVQKNQSQHGLPDISIAEESFVLGVSGAGVENGHMETVKVELPLKSEIPVTLKRDNALSTESYIKEDEQTLTPDIRTETSQVHEEPAGEISFEAAGYLPLDATQVLSDSQLEQSSLDVPLKSEGGVENLIAAPTMDLDLQITEHSSAEPPPDPVEEGAPKGDDYLDLHVESNNGAADLSTIEVESTEAHEQFEEQSDELLQDQAGSDAEESTQESLVETEAAIPTVLEVDSSEDTGLVDQSAKLDTDRSLEVDAGYMGGDSATNGKEVRYRLDLSLLESSPDASAAKEELNDSVSKTPKGIDSRLSFGSPRSSQSPLEKFSTKFVASPRQTSPVVAASPINTSLLDDEEDDFLSRPIKLVNSPMPQGAWSHLSRQAYFEYAAKNFSDPQWIEERISESCDIIWKDKEVQGYINSVDLISDFEKIAHQFDPVSTKYGEVRKEWKEDIDIHRAQVYCRVRDIAADLWSQNNGRSDVFSGLPRTSKFSRKEPTSIIYQEFLDICRRNVKDSDDEKSMPPMWSSAYENSSAEKELATKMAKTKWEQTKEAVNEISNQIGSQTESEMSTEVVENIASEYMRKKRSGYKAMESQIFEDTPKTSTVEVKRAPYVHRDSLDESLL